MPSPLPKYQVTKMLNSVQHSMIPEDASSSGELDQNEEGRLLDKAKLSKSQDWGDARPIVKRKRRFLETAIVGTCKDQRQ